MCRWEKREEVKAEMNSNSEGSRSNSFKRPGISQLLKTQKSPEPKHNLKDTLKKTKQNTVARRQPLSHGLFSLNHYAELLVS